MTAPVSSDVFVFGSNLAGRHGRGAAFTAKMQYGAIYGQGEGLQGQSYAIPTKDVAMRSLSLSAISRYVDAFLRHANKNPNVTFNVTPIGTGLAGFSHDDIGPMFANAPKNCKLPIKWKVYMMEPDNYNYWNC